VAKTPSPLNDVVRRKDLLQLFDTTPDVSGNDLDMSRSHQGKPVQERRSSYY
jgi:hypothetical protein